jgi:hypothetical protein
MDAFNHRERKCGSGGGQVVISAHLVRVMDGGCSVCHEVKTDGILLTREKGGVEVRRGAGSYFCLLSPGSGR